MQFKDSIAFKKYCHRIAKMSNGKINANHLMMACAAEHGYTHHKPYQAYLDGEKNRIASVSIMKATGQFVVSRQKYGSSEKPHVAQFFDNIRDAIGFAAEHSDWRGSAIAEMMLKAGNFAIESLSNIEIQHCMNYEIGQLFTKDDSFRNAFQAVLKTADHKELYQQAYFFEGALLGRVREDCATGCCVTDTSIAMQDVLRDMVVEMLYSWWDFCYLEVAKSGAKNDVSYFKKAMRESLKSNFPKYGYDAFRHLIVASPGDGLFDFDFENEFDDTVYHLGA